MNSPLSARHIIRFSRHAVIATLVVAAALLLSITCSHAIDSPTKAGAGQRLKTIIVDNYHPYTFLNDKGQPDGFSVEIARAVTKAMDLELDIRVDKWDVAMKELEVGKIDLLPMMAYSPERDIIFDFSVPHTIAYDAIFTRKGGPQLRTLKNLSGKTVIVMNKDIAHSYLLSSGLSKTMTIQLVDSLPDALKQLASGIGDAAIMPKLVGLVTAKKLNLPVIETSPQLIDSYTRPFSFAVKDDNHELLERLNQGLSIIKNSGEYDAIYKKWFGAFEEPHVHWKEFIKYGFIIVLILLGFLIWNVILKRQVKAKTAHLEAEIVQRKLTEKILLQEHNRAQSYLDTVEAIIVALDGEAKITTINRKACQILGYKEHELLGQNWFSTCLPQPEGMEKVYPYYLELMAGKIEGAEYLENAIATKSGELRQIAWHNSLLHDEQGKICGTLSAGEDITERKLGENELRESKEFLELTQRSAGAGSWTWDFATNQLHWSPEQYLIFGVEPVPGTLVFDLWRSVVHPDDLTVAESNIKNAICDHSELFNEYRIIKPSGEVRWINALGQTSYDDLGEPQRMSGICLDVTDRKKIENIQSDLLRFASLHPDEDFFESLASYLAMVLKMDYVCIDRLHGDNLTATTLAVYHNGEFEDNVTYTLQDTPCGDVVGKEICLFPSGVRSLFPRDAALQDLQAESYVGTTLWSFDMKPIGLIAVIGRNPLQDTRFSETVLKLVSNRAAGELERRQVEQEKRELEQQFQHAQKLESLGVLSGGIAHDFNNILAIIVGNCGLAKMDTENAENYIPEIEKAAERAAGLCRQMLAYAGKAQLAMAQVNMWLLVDEMVNMLKATLPRNAVIKPDLSAQIPYICADESQIRQIVMNLIINASEAIGTEQGEIQVSLSRTTVTDGQATKDYHGISIPIGEYVCLEVTDTGCGMDEETKWRIFEPFYTTKFSGRGLGMSAVLGIIKSHDGALQLFSQLGQGTTFKVYLPVPRQDSTGDENTGAIPSASWKGSGTILLVEDEDQVRLIAKALLNNFGFTVLEAVNGKEALELYLENAADILLVLTDMGMPVMDGYELFQELKKINPELPIIVSSGYGDAEVRSRVGSDNVAGLISKPYNPVQLREVLRGVVDYFDLSR